MQRWGPQPPEAVLSVLLQEFPSYTVETLQAADMLALEQIIDYRRAQLAIDLFNGGRNGAEELGKRPDLTALLLEIAKAQGGDETELDDVYRTLKAQQPDDDEVEEDD